MIIGFCGHAGSGKSEASKFLVEKHGFKKGKFAGALKEMTRAFLRYRGVDDETIERMIEGDLKEVPSEKLGGRSPRYFMIHIGTEFGRDLIHPDLWVETEMDHVKDWPDVVFDDVRFANEAAAIHKRGGIVVRILPATPRQVVNHISEAMNLDFDITIKNDGTITDLHSKLESLLNIPDAKPGVTK